MRLSLRIRKPSTTRRSPDRANWRRRTRRAAIALVAIASIVGNRVAIRAAEEASERIRYEYTKPEMGLPFRIALYAADDATARSAAQAAFDRIHALNAIFSDYDPDSELSRLCAVAGTGRSIPISADLWAVLARSRLLAVQSDGAFDVTVGPFIQLWRRARLFHELPDPTAIESARAKVGYRRVRLREETRAAELELPGMRLDLGGIAKGYAIDAALQVLKSRGVHRALVAGGGDIGVGDPPPERDGWMIEIAPLDYPGAPQAKFVSLSRKAVATSGDVFQRLEIDGKRYSHIVDPKTGVGLTDHSLVTVIAGDCTTADSLATTVSVLGPDRGLRLIEHSADVEAHVVLPSVARPPVETRETSGFGRFYTTDAPGGARPN